MAIRITSGSAAIQIGPDRPLGIRVTDGAGIALGLGSVPAEARAYFARASPPFSTARKDRIGTLASTLKRAGILDRLDGLYLGLDSAGNHAALNLARAAYDYTTTGGSVLDTDGAYKSQANSYIRTGWRFSDAGVKAKQDDFHVGVWSDTDAISDNFDASATGGTGNVTFLVRRSPNSLNGRLNTLSPNPAFSVTSTTGYGHVMIQRTAANREEGYVNAVLKGSTTTASTGTPTGELIFLGFPGQSFSARRFFALHWGRSLTADQVSTLNNALIDWLDSILLKAPADE